MTFFAVALAANRTSAAVCTSDDNVPPERPRMALTDGFVYDQVNYKLNVNVEWDRDTGPTATCPEGWGYCTTAGKTSNNPPNVNCKSGGVSRFEYSFWGSGNPALVSYRYLYDGHLSIDCSSFADQWVTVEIRTIDAFGNKQLTATKPLPKQCPRTPPPSGCTDNIKPNPPIITTAAKYYATPTPHVTVKMAWGGDNGIPLPNICPNGVGYCVETTRKTSNNPPNASCTNMPFRYHITRSPIGSTTTTLVGDNTSYSTENSVECVANAGYNISFSVYAIDANGNESANPSASTYAPCPTGGPPPPPPPPIQQSYEDKCAELTAATLAGAPSPLAILCPVVRYLNLILYASAAIFIIMVFLSAIKFAMSQGDPKALQGAKGSLTWTIIGFIVVIGVFTILVILKNVLGLEESVVLNPIGVLNKNLTDLFDKFGIKNY